MRILRFTKLPIFREPSWLYGVRDFRSLFQQLDRLCLVVLISGCGLLVSCRQQEEVVPEGKVKLDVEPKPSLVPQAEPVSFSPEAMRSSLQAVSTVIDSMDVQTHNEETSLEQHRVLIEELMRRVEILFSAPEHERRASKSRLEDLIEGLSRLKRADEFHGIKHSEGVVLLGENQYHRVELLKKLWREQPKFGHKIDSLFSRYKLLSCEHVPNLLENHLHTSFEE